MDNDDKPLVWLRGEVKTPPFSQEARVEAGFLLRCLQQCESLELPHSRDQCQVLERIAMSYAFETWTKIGESFIELTTMPF